MNEIVRIRINHYLTETYYFMKSTDSIHTTPEGDIFITIRRGYYEKHAKVIRKIIDGKDIIYECELVRCGLARY